MADPVLVTGATGTIGTQLVPRLAALHDSPVRVYVRDAGRAAPLEDAGARLLVGDFDDAEALGVALDGVDTLVLIAPPGPAAAQQNSRVLAAAGGAGVRKVVRISAIKAASDGPTENSRLHAISDDELRASGMTYVILRPNYFMQNLFMSLESINGENAIYGGFGDGRLAMIDVRDVVDCATAAATGDGFDNRVLELSGPESIGYSDVAAAIGRVAGRDIKYVQISPDDVRQAMLGMGTDEWMASLLRDYARAYRSGWGDLVTANVLAMTGHPPRSIDNFVEEVLAPALA